jgi:nucleotide-binding universal stress UspA family protein
VTNIVVGLDGSDSAAHALQWAVDEAKLRGTGVTAVLAWGLLDQRHPDAEQAFDPDYRVHDAHNALAAYVSDALGEAAAAHVQLRPVEDLPARALIDASDGATLLVVGGRGAGGLKGQLLGSVGYQCLHHARCPIAVVREGQPPIAPRAVSRIVVGVDGSESSAAALGWAVAEARLRGAQLDVVHAWHMGCVGAGAYAVAVDPAIYEDPARRTLAGIVGTIDQTGLAHPVASRLIADSAPGAILAAAHGADLVVMGTRGLGGFAALLVGAATSQVVHHAECPVVVIRVPE